MASKLNASDRLSTCTVTAFSGVVVVVEAVSLSSPQPAATSATTPSSTRSRFTTPPCMLRYERAETSRAEPLRAGLAAYEAEGDLHLGVDRQGEELERLHAEVLDVEG